MKRFLKSFVALAAMLGVTATASAVKIADVTRLYGQQNNLVTGVGLVYGLKGTGDGNFAPALRPLQQMLERYEDAALLSELKDVSNVAVVTVIVNLPSAGIRRGDLLNVSVVSHGMASSLRGGTLISTQLTVGTGKNKRIIGIAGGTVTIEDPSTPTSGIVAKGMVAEDDLIPQVIRENGRLTLVVEDSASSWGLASHIAEVINSEESRDRAPIAIATNARTIEIQIPTWERDRPDAFIARIQRLQLTVLPQEARVTINTKTGTILLSGDVEISPTAISYNGLSIQAVVPKVAPTPKSPSITMKNTLGLETGNIGTGGTRLEDLVSAFDQLKVPTQDRINILRELYKSGKLHAKLLIDGVMP